MFTTNRATRTLVAFTCAVGLGVGAYGLAGAAGPLPQQASPLAAADSGTVFVGVDPVRALDTRQGTGTPFGADETRTLALGSFIPPEATSVAINTTLTRATGPSFLTVYPTGSAFPIASVNNAKLDQDTPNGMLAELGTNQSIQIYNERNKVDVVIDVTGYFVPLSAVDGFGAGSATATTTNNGADPLTATRTGSATLVPVASFTAPAAGSYLLDATVGVAFADTGTVTAGLATTAFCQWDDGQGIEFGASITADVAITPLIDVPGLDTSNISVPGQAADVAAGDTVNLLCRTDALLPVVDEVALTVAYTATEVDSIN